MSIKPKFFKLWSQLNKENIFSQKDCWKCFQCKYSQKYQEYTDLFQRMTTENQLDFIKCQNNETKYWKISYSYCPYFKKQE